MGENSKLLYFLNTIITSEGEVKSVPTLVAPVYNPMYLDVATVLAIFAEGHRVTIESEPDKYIELDNKLALSLMDRYSISNTMIENIIKEAIRVQTIYDSLDSLKKLADIVIKMMGTPIDNLDSIGLLGRAIKQIIASGVYNNFDEVDAALKAVDSKLVKYTDDSIDALKSDTLGDFNDVETELSDLKSALTGFIASNDLILQDIRNGAKWNSFKEVEDGVAEALSQTHLKNKDTILDQGGVNEVSAENIVANIARVAEIDDLITGLDNELALHEGEIEELKNEVAELILKSHLKNKDTILDQGGVNEVSAADIKAFFEDTLEQLNLIINKGSTTETDLTALREEIALQLEAICNSTEMNSFKDVEDYVDVAMSNVHEQGTDLELAKGTADNISAKTIKEAIASYAEKIAAMTTDITNILKDAVEINSFKEVEDALANFKGGHEQNTDTALAVGTDKEVTVDDIQNAFALIQQAVDAGSVIISEDTIANAMSRFLAQTPDGETIIVEESKLKAKNLIGLTAAIKDLNYVTGVKSNVQAQLDAIVTDYNAKINALTGSGGFQGYTATRAELTTATSNTSAVDGVYIVGADETKGGATTLYRYDKLNNLIKYLGTFNIEVRNFATNPINLDTETTGVLSKYKLAQSFLDEIQELKDATHDPGNDTMLAKGTLAQVTALEIRNCIDKVNWLQTTGASSLISDDVTSGVKTWSSYKINLLLSDKISKDNVYTKTESDTRYAMKNEAHTHLNSSIIEELDEDEYGNLTYRDSLVGANLNLITKTFTERYTTNTLSSIIYLRDYLLNKGLIYPNDIDVLIVNRSSIAQPFQIKTVQNSEEVTLLDINMDSGEEQLYNITPDIETKLFVRGIFDVTITITAYKLSDYIENIDLNYHAQGTDTVVGKNTENEMSIKFIRDNLRKLESLNEDFLHEKGTDIEIGKGTAYHMTAEEIKTLSDNKLSLTQSAIYTVPSVPKSIIIPCNNMNKTIIECFKVLETDENVNVSQTINTMLPSEIVGFDSDNIDMVSFDGDMKLKTSILATPTQTGYDGGELFDIDTTLNIPLSSIVGITIKDNSVKTLTKIAQDTPANGYMRYNVSGNGFAKDNWDIIDDATVSGGKYLRTTISGAPLKFNFIGDSISIIGNLIGLNTCVVKIDGVEYAFNEYGTGKNYRVFNMEGLPSMYEHSCEIYLVGEGAIEISNIDVNIGSEINPYTTDKIQTGGILFYKDGKYYKYENDTYVHVYDALPSSTIFLTEGLTDVTMIKNIGSYMFRLYTKSIPKKTVELEFHISTSSVFVKMNTPIAIDNVMKSIDFLSLNAVNVKVVFSLDCGVTWMYSENDIFKVVDISSLNNIETYGMDVSSFNSINWNPYIVDGKLNLTVGYLLIDETSAIHDLTIQYDMSAYLEKINASYILKNGTAEIVISDSTLVNQKVVINKIE